jgi:hypothetical protein
MTPRPRRRSLRRGAAAVAVLALVASAAPVAADVRRPDATSATFVNYAAPEGIAQDAAEPTLGVNWNTGKVLYQAFLETVQVTFDDATLPATATWKDVSRPPTNIESLDPILHTDEITGRTIVSQLAPPCSIAAFTDSDGEPTATNPNGYLPSAACGVGANFDHQTVHFGKSVQPNPLYGPDRIAWYCSQVVVESTCAVSLDGGITFPIARPVYTFKGDLVGDPLLVGCEGLHGHLNTSPVDGTAYLPNFACNTQADLATSRPSVVVSPDQGLTWTIRQVPDATSPNFDADPAVDVDGGNRAYLAYEDATSNVRVATTTDRGQTWTPSVDLGAPYGIDNATMPTVIAGSDGRAAVAFLGTEAEAPLNSDGVPENQSFDFDPDGNDPKAGWHLYIAMTYDGGATWTTHDVTPDDPVQRGCIWWGSPQGVDTACQSAEKRNLLDFIDIAVDEQGRVVVGWGDGCVKRCTTEGHTRQTNATYAERAEQDADLTVAEFEELYSQVRRGAITRQSCGRGLFEEFDADPAGPLALCAQAGTPITPITAPGASPSAPVVAAPGGGSALPATGATPVLALGGVLVLGALALTRRRA